MFTFPLNNFEIFGIVSLLITFGLFLNSTYALYWHTNVQVKQRTHLDHDPVSRDITTTLSFLCNTAIFYDIQLYLVALSALVSFRYSRTMEVSYFLSVLVMYFTLAFNIPRMLQCLVLLSKDSISSDYFRKIKKYIMQIYIVTIIIVSIALIVDPSKYIAIISILIIVLLSDLAMQFNGMKKRVSVVYRDLAINAFISKKNGLILALLVIICIAAEFVGNKYII